MKKKLSSLKFFKLKKTLLFIFATLFYSVVKAQYPKKHEHDQLTIGIQQIVDYDIPLSKIGISFKPSNFPNFTLPFLQSVELDFESYFAHYDVSFNDLTQISVYTIHSTDVCAPTQLHLLEIVANDNISLNIQNKHNVSAPKDDYDITQSYHS